MTIFGQEFNDESYAICKADMPIRNQGVANIAPGRLKRVPAGRRVLPYSTWHQPRAAMHGTYILGNCIAYIPFDFSGAPAHPGSNPSPTTCAVIAPTFIPPCHLVLLSHAVTNRCRTGFSLPWALPA